MCPLALLFFLFLSSYFFFFTYLFKFETGFRVTQTDLESDIDEAGFELLLFRF